MKIIGLTGSIGMGKSTTAMLFGRLGVPVHDSDRAAHDALLPSGQGFSAVIDRFPDVHEKISGHIDRGRLGAAIFADAAARKDLEKIVHPIVFSSQRRFIARSKRMRLKGVVLDIPLLFETGGETRCDAVICVTAPYFLQRQRVLARKGMSEKKFQSILSQQMPDAEKKRRADFILHTGLGRAHALRQAEKILKVIL